MRGFRASRGIQTFKTSRHGKAFQPYVIKGGAPQDTSTPQAANQPLPEWLKISNESKRSFEKELIESNVIKLRRSEPVKAVKRKTAIKRTASKTSVKAKTKTKKAASSASKRRIAA